MKERKPSSQKRRHVRAHTASPLRYAPHTAPFERDRPVASAALEEDVEQLRRAQVCEERDDLFGGMV